MSQDVLEGHRFARVSIQTGAPLLSWGLPFGRAIRTIESVKTVVLYHDGKTILREGVLGSSRDVDAGSPTFSAALRASVETYAPDLQAVPARVDFGCLPKNAQAALIQPFSRGGVVVACDRKRALSPRDVAKIRVVARRLGERLS